MAIQQFYPPVFTGAPSFIGTTYLSPGDTTGSHKDPFDRLLVAQARTEPMRLLTNDEALIAYGDFVVMV